MSLMVDTRGHEFQNRGFRVPRPYHPKCLKYQCSCVSVVYTPKKPWRCTALSSIFRNLLGSIIVIEVNYQRFNPCLPKQVTQRDAPKNKLVSKFVSNPRNF